MQLNVSDLNIEDSVARQQLLGQIQKTGGTFLDNGYERCDTTKGTSYCYSFWVPDNNGKPKILNQGAFIYVMQHGTITNITKITKSIQPGASCSKLTMSLVKDSLKFQT